MISKKYFRKHLNQHHFEKIFSKILQTMCATASYVNNKNERVTLAHARGVKRHNVNIGSHVAN